MLVERQRHVQVVHALPLRDSAISVSVPRSGKAAIAEVIAAGAVVHESDTWYPELTVLEDPLRDQAPQFACAGDEDALQADACTPATLQQLADALTRHVSEHDVQREEQRPDQLRHLVGAAPSPRRRRSRPGSTAWDDAEHDRQDGADEHREESSTRERPRRSR